MPNILVIFFIFLLSSCSEEATLSEINGKTMGTTYSVKVVSESELNVSKIEIENRLDEINRIFSNWDPKSEISLLDSLPSGAWVSASDELRFVLQESVNIMHQTDGVFDPGIGRLIDIWGFGPKPVKQKPNREMIKEALQNSSLLNLDISNEGIKKNIDIHINLSAIAKGYAVDEIAKILINKGQENFIVEIGGEVFAYGEGLDKEWTVGIEKPNSQQVIAIELNNMAIATSGNYRNFFIWEGEKYNHIIDPTSGLPVKSDIASVSVIHPKTMIADAYATAMIVMGSNRAIDLANKLNLSIVLIYSEEQDFKEVKINL